MQSQKKPLIGNTVKDKMNKEKIRLEEVSKKYDGFLAVDKLSLSLHSGEVFGFLGPNGAGKTTTIKMIVGLLNPSSGRVYVDGLEVLKNPSLTKAKIGYIPDSPYLYSRLTGREFIYLVAGLYNLNSTDLQKRIDWLLDLFGIGDWVDNYSEEYSHGMKQKIVLASAIIHSPEILMVDEPMVGLDPESQKVVKDFFALYSESGGTVFMSTHTLSVAQEVCTKIGIINNGKLFCITTPEKLRNEAEQKGFTMEEYFLELTGGGRQVRFPE